MFDLFKFHFYPSCALLHTIEQTVGEEAFLVLVRKYIQSFKFWTITSLQFKTFCIGQEPKLKEAIDWDSWFFREGLPPMPFPYEEGPVNLCKDFAKSCVAGVMGGEVEASFWEDLAAAYNSKWGTEARIVFFEEWIKGVKIASSEAPADVAGAAAFLSIAEEKLNLKNVQNGEIRFQWHMLHLVSGAGGRVEQDLRAFLTGQGRMKYTRPLYRAWAAVDAEAAKSLFAEFRDFYHPICRELVAKDLAAA